MKLWKMLAALLALAALCAVPARAQVKVTDRQSFRGIFQFAPMGGIYWPDTTGRLFSTNDDGSLQTREVNPAQSYYLFEQNWKQTRLVVGNSDTTAVVDTRGANHLYLYILGTTDSLTCSAVWGIQVRRNVSTVQDSVGSFPALRWSNLATTTRSGVLMNAANDTLGTRGINSYAATSTTPQVDEMLYVVPNIAQAGNPRGRSVELLERNGAPLTAAYLSLRLRLIALSPGWANGTCSSDTTGRSSSIRIHLVGTR